MWFPGGCQVKVQVEYRNAISQINENIYIPRSEESASLAFNWNVLWWSLVQCYGAIRHGQIYPVTELRVYPWVSVINIEANLGLA